MKDKLLALKHCESYIVPESDYGKAEIWRINDVFILFEIPTYGGAPAYVDTYFVNDVDSIIEQIDSWT